MKSDFLVIHTDGGARGNPGPAACAFVVEKENKIIFKGSSFLGKTTNNIAEYQGVLLALQWITKNFKEISEIVFYLDSELVVRQLTGVYKIKNENLIKVSNDVKVLLQKIPPKVIFKNVPRSQNKKADTLVNEELDKNS